MFKEYKAGLSNRLLPNLCQNIPYYHFLLLYLSPKKAREILLIFAPPTLLAPLIIDDPIKKESEVWFSNYPQ